MFGEVCEEVLGREVFECLSSGVQDIAWIDLKHIQIKVVGTCNVSMICTRQYLRGLYGRVFRKVE